MLLRAWLLLKLQFFTKKRETRERNYTTRSSQKLLKKRIKSKHATKIWRPSVISNQNKKIQRGVRGDHWRPSKPNWKTCQPFLNTKTIGNYCNLFSTLFDIVRNINNFENWNIINHPFNIIMNVNWDRLIVKCDKKCIYFYLVCV